MRVLLLFASSRGKDVAERRLPGVSQGSTMRNALLVRLEPDLAAESNYMLGREVEVAGGAGGVASHSHEEVLATL